MKQTAIQQAIVMVRSRIDSIDETLMGKHTAHHLQQVERGLYELLEKEKVNILLEKEKVNIESNPLNGSSFMNDLRNKYMEKQTAVEWLESRITVLVPDDIGSQLMYKNSIKKAKDMEKERMIEFANRFYDECGMQYGGLEKSAEEYYNETFNTKEKCLSCDCEKQDYVLYCEFCRQEI
jgi:hypothetical protein